MRWSENETYKFVKLYLKYETLWNPHFPSYKLKDTRIQAYRNLITDLRAATGILLSEEELRIKIKNLRSTYTQELVKIRQRSGPDCIYKPTMRWFAEWDRCYQRTKKQEKTDEFQCEDDDRRIDDEDASEKIWVSSDIVDNENDVDADPFVSQTDDAFVYILKSDDPSEVQCKSENETIHNTYKAKRKKIKRRSPSTDQSDRTFRGSMDSSTEAVNKEDEFDIYGKYIASQLRQMDLHKALRLQLEIQGLVSEARISELSSKQDNVDC